MNSKGNVFWGIFLLVAAAFIVVGNMGLFGDIINTIGSAINDRNEEIKNKAKHMECYSEKRLLGVFSADRPRLNETPQNSFLLIIVFSKAIIFSTASKVIISSLSMTRNNSPFAKSSP